MRVWWKQEAQLSQRGRAMLPVTEYVAKSLTVTGNGTIRKLAMGTVSYAHSIATTTISLAVLTQYTNVTAI